MKLEEKIQLLEAENAELTANYSELQEVHSASLEQIKLLEEKVLYLLQQLEKKTVKKDSHNSHNPPSSDKGKPKRNQSLRPKTTRKTGGQPGHKGSTLIQKEQSV